MSESYEEVLQALRDRDEQDMNRKVEPLRRAEDAELVDSSNLSFEETVQAILEVLK